MANNKLVLAAAFVVGFIVGILLVKIMSAQQSLSQFSSDFSAVPPYDLVAPLPATGYNSMHTYSSIFGRNMSCDDCFEYGIQSAQADAIYAIKVGSSTAVQRVLPDTILAWNGFHNVADPAQLLPVQSALISAAARVYSAHLRGTPHCVVSCPATRDDLSLWNTPRPADLAQLWCGVAVMRGTATPTQKLVYASALAATPTDAQKELLSLSCRQIALRDAQSATAPTRAQIALNAAAIAAAAGKDTPLQNYYYNSATPYVVANFDAALLRLTAGKESSDDTALLATLPPA